MLNLVYDKCLSAYVSFSENINNFRHSEKGVTAVEYAIVIAGVAAVVTVVFGSGGSVQTTLTSVFAAVTTKITALVK